jgi:predicted dehydrogenase
MTPLDVGIAGAAGRGGAFRDSVEAHEDTEIAAVCDTNLDALASAEEFDDYEQYRDYYTMLWEADPDLVVLGTPAPHHVHQSIAALKRDVHVISEVPAGKNVGECEALVEEAERSDATYLMAENYVYREPNMLVRSLVEDGLFGQVYYAEGEYLHELKEYDEQTKWRRTWKSGINGIPYPTHSLGPVLSWMPDDRVDRVSCAGSGHHYTDPEGEEYVLEDTTVMLAKTEQERLIKIRFDRLSERPHAASNYQLQGTEGCYEAARAGSEDDRIWLSDREEADSSGGYAWESVADLPEEYHHPLWRDPPESAASSGHGGADSIMMHHFLDYLTTHAHDDAPIPDPEVRPPIGVHDAMDMTLPGLLSLESIDRDGEWLPVPDSRDWSARV